MVKEIVIYVKVCYGIVNFFIFLFSDLLSFSFIRPSFSHHAVNNSVVLLESGL